MNYKMEDFALELRGDLITPDHENYDDTRAVYNASIDKYPKMIVQCEDAADVMSCVEFGRENDLTVSIRGGGHSGPGFGVCDEGLVIDLAKMNSVQVDPEKRQVRVEGGALIKDLDHATHAFGLALPTGVIATTGIGGLTVGGGHGYLSRKYGLTIDSLVEADVILADGRQVKASENKNPDLFWAIRGGGGNFGVITSFLFDLHPVKNIYGGPSFWELEDAPKILEWYREFIVQAPNDFYAFFAFLTVPPAPPFPEHLHGKKMCGILWCCTGPVENAESTLNQVFEKFPPAFKHVAEMPYPALQTMHDALYPKGLQWYWKGNYVNGLSDEAIEKNMEHAARMPAGLSTMHLYPINGEVHNTPSDETAFAYRDSIWSQVIVGIDPDPEKFDDLKSWSRNYWEELQPYSANGAYQNFMMDEEAGTVEKMFGENHERLVEIKQKYDPGNFFRVNQNIEPALVTED